MTTKPSRTINVYEAKTHLSRLLDKVSEGEEVVIARAGRPVARLVPAKGQRQPRTLGVLEGAFTVPDDFDAPLPEDVLAIFDEEDDAPPR